MKIETLYINDNEINYFTFGEGKKNLIMLPGLSLKSVMNYSQAIKEEYHLLNDDFKVYVLDYHVNLNKDYSLNEIAQDIIDFINELKLEDIYLYGVSLGGFIALDIALKDKLKIEKLLVASTSLRNNNETLFEKWSDLAINENKKELALSFGENVYPTSVFENSKDALIEMVNSSSEKELKRFIYLLKTMRNFNIVDKGKDIKIKTLFINDKKDMVFNYEDVINDIKETNNNLLDIYLFDGYGHAAYDLCPDFQEELYKYFKY